jgi:hypothetical protein
MNKILNIPRGIGLRSVSVFICLTTCSFLSSKDRWGNESVLLLLHNSQSTLHSSSTEQGQMRQRVNAITPTQQLVNVTQLLNIARTSEATNPYCYSYTTVSQRYTVVQHSRDKWGNESRQLLLHNSQLMLHSSSTYSRDKWGNESMQLLLHNSQSTLHSSST